MDPAAREALKQRKVHKAKQKPKFGDGSPEFLEALKKAQHWANTYDTADEIPDGEIPESYDFSNIDGYDFTGPVKDQGACGSCYTVSFTAVV